MKIGMSMLSVLGKALLLVLFAAGPAVASPTLCSDAIRTIEHPEQVAVEQVLDRVQKGGVSCFVLPFCCGPSWSSHPECYVDVLHNEIRVVSPASSEPVQMENCQEVSPEEAADRLFRNIFDPTLPIRKVTDFNPVSAGLSVAIGAANAARHPLPADVASQLASKLALAAGKFAGEDIQNAGWLRFDEQAAKPLWALVPNGDSGDKVAAAITFDRTVILGPDFLAALGSDRFALWAHEVTHVAQYRKQGRDQFLLNYIGGGAPKPYCKIDAEVEAYWVERAFRDSAGNSSATACERGVSAPAREYIVQASQISAKLPTGVSSLNVTNNCGAGSAVSHGFLCSEDPTKPGRAVYDLRRGDVNLPAGNYSLEIEYAAPSKIPGVAITTNGATQLIDFPATGGSGMNARGFVRTNVTFSGGKAELAIDRGGLLPELRGLVFRRVF